MFRAIGRKNTDGKFLPIRVQEADKAIPEYLDGYQNFEIKAVEHLEEELAVLRNISSNGSVASSAEAATIKGST